MSKFYTSVVKRGNSILYRGIEDGKSVIFKENYKPYLFTNSKDPTEWKSLYGDYLKKVSFESIDDANSFIETYTDVEGFDIHGMEKFQYSYIADNFPDEITYNLKDINTCFLDIEVVDIENKGKSGFPSVITTPVPIVLITPHYAHRKTIVYGLKHFNVREDDKFEYRQYDTEQNLLKAFIIDWADNYPDILTGWNTDGFDIIYLINRVTKVLGKEWANKLSPWGIITEKNRELFGKQVKVPEILGINSLDYLALYKKFGTYSGKESYALGFIANLELGETKLDLPGDSFYDSWENHYDTFVRYNYRDSLLVEKLDNKKKLLDLIITMSFMIKCNFGDVFGPVNSWDVFIFNYLLKKKIAVPAKEHKVSDEFPGAYVKEPKHGLRGWTIYFDFSALYPNIIIQWNISPETLVKSESTIVSVSSLLDLDDSIKEYLDFCAENDYSIAANGAMYRKNVKGIIPEIMGNLISGRSLAKNEMLRLEKDYESKKSNNEDINSEAMVEMEKMIDMLDNKQMAIKIFANSGYGALTNQGFRYFELKNGEAITLSGQLSSMHIERTVNNYFNKILKTSGKEYAIYLDTDSCVIDVDPLVKKIMPDASDEKIVKFLLGVGKEMQNTVIKESTDHIFKLCNGYSPVMNMKLESIASKGFWVGKKKYAIKVHNSEGVDYNPPKIKVVGLEIVRSSTPQKIRGILKECINIIFDKDENSLQVFIEENKRNFMVWDLEDISFPRGVSDIDKYDSGNGIYKPKCPIAVRGAILYNHHFGMGESVLNNGDKVKFCYLKMPNVIRENVISYPADNKFPESLKKYVDKEAMWEKGFIDPLTKIVDSIKWNLVKRSTLEDFFS